MRKQVGAISYPDEWKAAQAAMKLRKRYPMREYRIVFLPTLQKWIVEQTADFDQWDGFTAGK